MNAPKERSAPGARENSLDETLFGRLATGTVRTLERSASGVRPAPRGASPNASCPP